MVEKNLRKLYLAAMEVSNLSFLLLGADFLRIGSRYLYRGA